MTNCVEFPTKTNLLPGLLWIDNANEMSPLTTHYYKVSSATSNKSNHKALGLRPRGKDIVFVCLFVKVLFNYCTKMKQFGPMLFILI